MSPQFLYHARSFVVYSIQSYLRLLPKRWVESTLREVCLSTFVCSQLRSSDARWLSLKFIMLLKKQNKSPQKPFSSWAQLSNTFDREGNWQRQAKFAWWLRVNDTQNHPLSLSSHLDTFHKRAWALLAIHAKLRYHNRAVLSGLAAEKVFIRLLTTSLSSIYRFQSLLGLLLLYIVRAPNRLVCQAP